MITEPEFDGGSSGLPVPEALESPEGPQGPQGYGRSPYGRRPWRWALGGALLASVPWAGAWWAATPQDPSPPLRYALPQSLCDSAKLPGLARLAERIAWDSTPRQWEHPGVDRAMCMLRTTPPESAEGPERWLAYEVQVSMELHKRTDPAAEFGADPGAVGWVGLGRPDLRSVPGLGERALISETEYESGWRLAVLDGGTVFTMDVSVWSGGDGEPSPDEPAPEEPPKPDSDAVQAAMIDDMHGLMKALHR
ncbi:hypothetical protein [Streptomyces sp. NPDC058401]|uniref:hypothetical protein n=1 Tax=Streptomyces sp. NPDC058401 TaxID=3346480 RepID=UPI00365221F7